MDLDIVILAAGKGLRMRSSLPKVLHDLGGKPLLQHVIDCAQQLKPRGIYMVIGEEGETIKAAMQHQHCQWVLQAQAQGTGHAVLQALPLLHAEYTLILCGDVPLITPETLSAFIKQIPENTLGLISFIENNPFGFGRVLRDKNGDITGVVEEKDADTQQKLIQEVLAGIYFVKTSMLQELLPLVTNHNASGEYYLPDIIIFALNKKYRVTSFVLRHKEEAYGVNNKAQLAQAERIYQCRKIEKLMQDGLMVRDPNRVDIRGNLIVDQDVILDVDVVIEGEVCIGKGSRIGPFTYLKDVKIGQHVEVHPHSVIEGAVIESNCSIGPFARIRPDCHISSHAKVGNFVELKKTHLGENSKVNHLSYVGDTIVQENVNIGAGTITCNYDGVNKYQTTIKHGAFIGSHTALVAPVVIGENAVIGAGSVITRDTPDEKLTLSRAPQKTVDGWHRPEQKEKE